MAARRAKGEDSIYFDHLEPDCRDPKYHRGCAGRWRGAISLGYDGSGKRIRRKVSGHTKTAVKDELERLRSEMAEGVRTSGSYTLQQAVDDWLQEGMSGRSRKTIDKYRYVLKPVLACIGGRVLRELTAGETRNALSKLAASHSTDTVGIARLSLERAIRHAESSGLVRRNVVQLIDTPRGQVGRPSRALSPAEAEALIAASAASRLRAYILLSLMTGVRTEEARALQWDHVVTWAEALERWLPVSEAGWDHADFAVYVWRSVRSGGDTKTARSRRTLALPGAVAAAIREEWKLQEADRRAAGGLWREHGLVFTTSVGTPLDPSKVRKRFKRVCRDAGIGESWTPRELRHTFVSLMSEGGVSVEEIAHLVGHSSTRTTETVYRHELRPVLRSGAKAMDRRFGAAS
jgi:integrase